MASELVCRYVGRETCVFLLVDDDRLLGIDIASTDTVRPQRFIDSAVKKRFVVVSPSCRRCSVDAEVEVSARSKVFYLHSKFGIRARFVVEIGSLAVVGTYVITAENKSVLTFCHFVYIENNLFGSLHRAFATAECTILLAFFATAVIVISVFECRITLVVLFDTPDYLVVDTLLQLFGRRHNGIGVGIFGFQIVDYFWVVFVLEPIVRVDTFGAEIDKSIGDSFGYRRFRKIALIHNFRTFFWGITRCYCSHNDGKQHY